AGSRPTVFARFDHWFFTNFFRLFLGMISLSQASVLVWLVGGKHVSSLVALTLLALVLHAINLALAKRMRHRHPSPNPAARLPRVYYAVAFTSVFCFVFLLLSGFVWGAVKIVLGAAVEARPTSLALSVGSDVDTAFRWLT